MIRWNNNQESTIYEKKIISYQGHKAKVLKDTGDELKITLKKDGKYQNKPISVKKGEVSLLDKRKHPENYPLSVEEKEIEAYLNILSREPSNAQAFFWLLDTVREAQKNWIDISKYIKRIDEARRKYFLMNIEEDLNNIFRNPENTESFFSLERTMITAKKIWINVSQYENIFHEFRKKYYVMDIEKKLKKLQKNPSNDAQLALAKTRIGRAEEIGIDVSQYKIIFHEIIKKHRLAHIKEEIKKLQKKVISTLSIRLVEQLIKEAKGIWLDVSKYEVQLLEITKKHYLTKLEDGFNTLQKDPANKNTFELHKMYLKEAKELWINVNKYKEQLPNLTKKHYLTIIKECLKWIQEYPSDPEKIRLLETYLEEAKEVWLNVSEYEKLIPEIIKNYYLANLEERLKTLLENPEDEISVELFAFHLQRAIANWSDITKYIEGFKQYAKKAREARVDMDFIEKYPELNQLYLEVIKSMTKPKNLETR